MNDPAPITVDPPEGSYCPACGYDLRALTSDRCPECGLDVRGASLCTVPWQDRRIGRIRAFVQTVVLATFRPGRMARAIAAPIYRRDAARFFWIVLVLSTGVVLAFFLYQLREPGGAGSLNLVDQTDVSYGINFLWELKLMWSAGATMTPVLPIGLVVTFLLATRLVRFAFVNRRLPAELQWRAAALGYYAQAPLAWLLVWAFAAASDHALQAADLERMWRELWIMLKCIAAIGVVLATVGCAWSVVRVQMRLPQSSPLRWAVAGVWVPLSWAIAVVIGFGALPCIIGLTWIAVDSLR